MQKMVWGEDFAYSEAGNGIPLVLIHGYPLSRAIWNAQLQDLAGQAYVLAPDLPGFGESAPAAGASIGRYADFVAELLDDREITRPAVICGLSMGGYVAFEFYRRYANRVAGLILANTKAGPDSAEGKAGRDQSAALAREKGVGAIVDAMLPKLLSPKTYTARPALVQELSEIMRSSTVEGVVAALQAMRDRPDSTPTLQSIDRPVLAIAGADDQLFPRAELEKIAQGVKQGKLVVLQDAGHVSCMEQPDAFSAAVGEFIKPLG